MTVVWLLGLVCVLPQLASHSTLSMGTLVAPLVAQAQHLLEFGLAHMPNIFANLKYFGICINLL